MKSLKIAVIGDGGWGTTLAILLSRKGHRVKLWGAFQEYIGILKKKRENVKFLPGIKIPREVLITSSLEDALKDIDLLVLAVPSQYMRDIITKLKGQPSVSKSPVLSVTKGIEVDTLKRMSEVIAEVLRVNRVAVLSGPTIALEVAKGIPTTCVVSSEDEELAKGIQDTFMTENFRVYTNADVIGVELGGSLKNIIAIAAGISDGLGFGTNTKAALLTRGLVEIIRLGVAMGARPETFYGLSGLGDLATTCMSRYSRNRWLGDEIGKGNKLNDVLRKTEMVVEGVATTKSVCELAKRNNVEMPIANEIYKVLYENKSPKGAVYDLMTRSARPEGRQVK